MFLAGWAELDARYKNPEILEDYEKKLELRDAALKVLEIARSKKKIGQGLEAAVWINPLTDESRKWWKRSFPNCQVCSSFPM